MRWNSEHTWNRRQEKQVTKRLKLLNKFFKHIIKVNYTCNSKRRADQRPRISFTGDALVMISFLRNANIIFIFLSTTTRFFSAFWTSSVISTLCCSGDEESWPWGMSWGKFTLARLALFMFECDGSLSGLHLLYFPAFTATSIHPALLSLFRKFPILNLMLVFHPNHPMSEPSSFRHGCLVTRASAAFDSSLSLG